MNRTRIAEALHELVEIFPQRKISEQMISTYQRHLEIIPEDNFYLVFEKILTTCKFFPTIADFLEINDSMPKPRKSAQVETPCPICDGNGLVYMEQETTGKHSWFLCPVKCRHSKEVSFPPGPIPKTGWKSKNQLALEWFTANPDHPNVIATKAALAKTTYKPDIDPVEYLKVTMKPLPKDSPWAYPKK